MVQPYFLTDLGLFMGSEVFSGRLSPGERLLWSGQPRQGVLLVPQDVFLIPFSLMWGGFAIFWEFSVTQSGGPIFFELWGVPFVLVGLYMIIGRFFFDAWVRQRIMYAVTDRRILIARTGPFGKFTSLDITRLPTLELSEGRNGRGTLRFGETASVFGRRNMSSLSPSLDGVPQFLQIENATSVFGLIQKQVPGRT